MCYNCYKRVQNLKQCARCHSVAYCGRECQLANWPEHKRSCKQMQRRAEESKQNETAQLMELFQEWFLLATSTTKLVNFILFHWGSRLLNMPETGACVLVELKYNCNHMTFLPSEPLAFLASTDNPQLHQLVQQCRSKTTRTTANFVCMLSVNNGQISQVAPFETPVPADLSTASLERCAEVCLLPLHLRHMPLAREILEAHAIPNWKYQIRSGLFQKPEWETFVLNALWVPCGENQSRHLSHVLIVEVKMGFAPGEIQEFLSYKVTSLSELYSMPFCTPELKAQWQKDQYNLIDLPDLVEERKTYPKVFVFPCLYIDWKALLYYTDRRFFEIDFAAQQQHSTQAQCNKVAKQTFHSMQQNAQLIPSVTYPTLG